MNPRPRLSLSWRLCISITFVVVAVMIAVSLPEHFGHQREIQELKEDWLDVASQPLVRVLAEGGTPSERELAMEEFRSSVSRTLGQMPSVRIEFEDGVISYGDADESWSKPILIDVEPRSAGVPQRILLNRDEFEIPGRWDAYWLHVFVTIAVLSGTLYGALRTLIARPLERLLDGVRLMEMGYWGEVRNTGGVWEIRWLSERFREMGLRLEKTVENLTAAERRGGRSSVRTLERTVASHAMREASVDASPLDDAAALRANLRSHLQELQELDVNSLHARVRAQEIWVQDPSLAEQLGEIDIKTRIEDAAFGILDPIGYMDLKKRLGESVPELLHHADSAESSLRAVLAKDGIPVVRMERRIKGLGSIWRKMESKGLLFSQVHDLLALRVVMQSTDDCYRTLHLIHLEFSPIVGRFKDYIADPKPNGYRSIHTSVRLSSEAVCEIQIRSLEMHQRAEAGDCAHWRYRLDTPHSRGAFFGRDSSKGASMPECSYPPS